ncbi:hypothetical protein IVB18_33580 [Bradyrhizobium sp. 186]|uniref:hypothetical protein n=1 Tax=Bradyrhizobium sp. 186 TaxID=2782654 RepID=UPI002001602E|nr:hypothetical protein [Bradyrhizobium sp. 186]UPK33126.1 hypothetical protein IVB18_33580 [Bradyrhizobium sp. 186]
MSSQTADEVFIRTDLSAFMTVGNIIPPRDPDEEDEEDEDDEEENSADEPAVVREPDED